MGNNISETVKFSESSFKSNHHVILFILKNNKNLVTILHNDTNNNQFDAQYWFIIAKMHQFKEICFSFFQSIEEDNKNRFLYSSWYQIDMINPIAYATYIFSLINYAYHFYSITFINFINNININEYQNWNLIFKLKDGLL